MAILKTGKEIGICVHHSVYKPANNMAELKAQAALFNTWHKSKEWAEKTKTDSAYPYISYHYLMATDGSILNVTDEKYVKYAAEDNFRGEMSFNLHGIHICLTGNYENDKPTPEMERQLVLFIRDYEARKKINAYIRGHKETSRDVTACPGINIGTSKSGWLKQVIDNVNDPNYPPVEVPSTPNCDEYIKKVSILSEENEALKIAVQGFKDNIKLLEERVAFLEADRKAREEEMKILEDDLKREKEERERFEKQYMEAVTELNELKAGKELWIKRLADILYKLFRRK